MARKFSDVASDKREEFYANYAGKILFKEKGISFTDTPNLYGMVHFLSMVVDSAMILEDAAIGGRSSIATKELLKRSFTTRYEAVASCVDAALEGTEVLNQYNDSFDAAIKLGEELFAKTRGAGMQCSVSPSMSLVPVGQLVRIKKMQGLK